MKVIILGAGRRGIRLAKHLVEERKNVVIIDDNPQAVSKAMTSVDCLAINCNGTDINSLEEAGVRYADAFIALAGSDETNLVSCGIVASEFKVPLTIAAVRNLSYTNTDAFMGISHIVNPYQEVAAHIYKDIEKGIYSDIINFDSSKLVLYNLIVTKGSPFADSAVKDLRQKINCKFIIAALSRHGEAIVPDGETFILPGDTLSLAADEESIEQILELNGKHRIKASKIAIVGGTKVSEFLVHLLPERIRKNTTFVAKDKEACETISQKYPHLLVINDNIVNDGIFSQERIAEKDLFIAITDNDELNIIAASYAKSLGTENTMALVCNNPDYVRMSNHMGIDNLISAQDVTVDSIMRYIHGTHISTIHHLFDGQLEVIEFEVPARSRLIGKALRNINMRGKGVIAGITRGDSNIIPDGNSVIEQGDTLILIKQRKTGDFIHRMLSREER